MNFLYKLLVRIFDKFQALSLYRSKYQIDESFRFNGYNILLYSDGKIICGKNSYIYEGSIIQSYKNCSVSIGKNCMISHNVRIYTQSNLVDLDFSQKPIPEKIGDVLIEDNVWIGANVFINPGVVIGNNAIVGANSVVTKSVEPFSIVGGVPAKFLRFKNIK